MNSDLKKQLVICGVIFFILLLLTASDGCSCARKSSYEPYYTKSYKYKPSYTARPTESPYSDGYTPKNSKPSSDYFDSSYNDDPEWFYEDNYDDFDSYEDAEYYWENY